jgi:hypothetical protein
MPRTSKTDASAQAKDPSPQPEGQTQPPLDDIAQTIAQRYYGCIGEIARWLSKLTNHDRGKTKTLPLISSLELANTLPNSNIAMPPRALWH